MTDLPLLVSSSNFGVGSWNYLHHCETHHQRYADRARGQEPGNDYSLHHPIVGNFSGTTWVRRVGSRLARRPLALLD